MKAPLLNPSFKWVAADTHWTSAAFAERQKQRMEAAQKHGGQRHGAAACCALERIATSEATCLIAGPVNVHEDGYTAGIVSGRRGFDSRTSDHFNVRPMLRAIKRNTTKPKPKVKKP